MISLITRRLYSIHATLAFSISYLILLMPFLAIIQNSKWHRHTALLNRIWARMFFAMIFMRVKVSYHPRINKKGQYLFCPNHFSYLDIPTMGFTPGNVIFVGKNAMEKVPLFGYMYRKLHITVNRESLRSKHNTFQRSKEAIDDGRSLVMYPEGGVITNSPPKMSVFKNGPFKIAIDKQIPIIPVTIPNNWILLPDDNRFLLKRGTMHVVFHEPIDTHGLNMNDLESLKQKVFKVIQSELNIQNENRQDNVREYSSFSSLGI